MRSKRPLGDAGSAVAMLPTMLAEDRRRAGWSVAQAAYELGVSVRAYRELEAGERRPRLIDPSATLAC